uniref:Peroxisomal sarcosine oxidase-like n=1 Tax=Crassostrea virginica TaxID=6565 RepID=A0A8B8DYH5_CRAVI|nr:peroxisomal sarcosine oxidase-like [Crassostrea virginica]
MYDVVVVGAGIEGSATAYNLVKNGQKTLLLEQFPLPHSRGSSHGHSRITRVAYGKDDHYAVMMKEGGVLWRSLEREAGVSIFLNCGCLAVGQPEFHFMKATVASLSRHGIRHDILTPGDLRSRYPMLALPEDYIGVFDYSGGVLRADRALRAFQTLFVKYGGELRDGEEVKDVIPGNVNTIVTSQGQYSARKVVVTVGPWAPKFLPRLGINIPLKTVLTLVLYWKEKNRGEYSTDRFPTYKNVGDNVEVYALPSLEYPGHVRVCYHNGPETDPDNRDKPDTQWILKRMQGYVRDHMPSLESTPSIVEPCMYTNTPDRQFVLDRHPVHKNIILGVGFSGHGFKLAPVVGKLLCELAMDRTPSYDLSPCRLDRFTTPAPRL